MTIDLTQDRILVKRLRNYRWEGDREFQKFAKRISNEYECYFELIGDGCYRLVKKRDVL